MRGSARRSNSCRSCTSTVNYESPLSDLLSENTHILRSLRVPLMG
jgi:hypothetical protein